MAIRYQKDVEDSSQPALPILMIFRKRYEITIVLLVKNPRVHFWTFSPVSVNTLFGVGI